ncbi:MAG TPA: Hsp20/alpha crystallin family protein [Candidatus Tectomicrobia bacterium]
MALVPWRPFEDFGTLRREMDRLLERFFGEPSGVERPAGSWAPRTNVTEANESLTITAELPGLEAKDVDVALSGDMLTIKGEKKQEKEEKDEYHHMVERSYGAFARMVRLPAPVAADKIKATFKNGVLTVTLPKTEETKPKAIPVQAE